MKAIVKELGQFLVGEITADRATREYFSTDASIFRVNPAMVIYPKNEADIMVSVKYLRDKAEHGVHIPITARGSGTDFAGGAIGPGAVMVMPAHFNKLVAYEKDSITVLPGMNYGTMQAILQARGRYLPAYPASINFSTVGGAVANNSSGEKSIKYGNTGDFVQALRGVLSSGDVIDTYRLSRRELKKKKLQNDFEGHLYRTIDQLIEANRSLIASSIPRVRFSSAGYNLLDVKQKDGSFDLTPLFVGAQGTLGIITEVSLAHVPYQKRKTLLVGFFDSVEKCYEAVARILPLGPSALELVDHNLLKFMRSHAPEQIDGLVPEQLPQLALLIEFDNRKTSVQVKKAKRVAKLFKRLCYDSRYATNADERDALWKIRRGAVNRLWMMNRPKQALPLLDDAIVPLERSIEFLQAVGALFTKYKLTVMSWGQAGTGNFHFQPLLDLANLRDRRKVLDLVDEFYKLVVRFDGSTSASYNDGRLRAPHLKKLYGAEMYKIFEQVKFVFDPYRIFNSGVKMGVTGEELAVHLRQDYQPRVFYDQMPGGSVE